MDGSWTENTPQTVAECCPRCGEPLGLNSHLCYGPKPWQPTRREYFAAKALSGLLASGSYFEIITAVQYADDLIAALDKEKT